MEYVEWCNFCNAAPKEGVITGILDGIDEPVELDACAKCAKRLFNEA